MAHRTFDPGQVARKAAFVPAVCMILSGCIIIPAGRGEPEPFEEQRLDFIEIGKTSKDELSAAMAKFEVETHEGPVVGVQPLVFRHGEWWLFVQSRQEMRWLVLIAHYDAGFVASEDYRYVLVQFDDQDVVRHLDLSKGEGGKCNDSGVCTKTGGHMLLASAIEDEEAKRFQMPADKCGVYLYSTKLHYAAKISLDRISPGWLVTKSTYLYLEIEPGSHQLSASAEYISNEKRPSVHSNFECTAGEAVFLKLRRNIVDYYGLRDFLIEDAEKGRRAIEKRKRMLPVSRFPSVPEPTA